ncbi:MAG: GSCFA domain-containing protein, partial [Parvibaculaceae bacterium]|nr:GSCFA domain-containing protein [Parvibaculaceae bacterium]
SCFAQHVGKWLTRNGYQWVQSEQTSGASFSFATGNIYTPALLRQWVELARNLRPNEGATAIKDGRYFDLLRPNFCVEGFETEQALISARQSAAQEILNYLTAADVFIFTLGLTEAWVGSDGTVYPMCPGTIAGEYDPAQYHFKNYTVDETITEMQTTFELIRAVNKDIKFLLTVSPVPLTATATDAHVLSASTYSKSILRAAAGALSNASAEVDYFPSFELISSHPQKGAFFEDNLREVKSDGVAFVMRHFQTALELDNGNENVVENQDTPSGPAQDQSPGDDSTDDTICEEVFLEGWNRKQQELTPQLERAPEFCLIGDSQLGKLSAAFHRGNIPHIGGMIMNGSAWTQSRFHLDSEDFFVPLENRRSRKFWSLTLDELEQATDLFGEKTKILTNIGLHTHRSVSLFMQWWKREVGSGPVTVNNLASFFQEAFAKHLKVLMAFVEAGHEVIIVSDPALQKFFPEMNFKLELFEFYDQTFSVLANQLNCTFFNARDWSQSEIEMDKSYCSNEVFDDGKPDWNHGSDIYYDALAKKLMREYSNKVRPLDSTPLKSTAEVEAETIEKYLT